MKKQIMISDAELEIMEVLWSEKRPMRIQEVLDLLKNNNWKYNTVGTLLLRLNEKGAVTSKKENRTILYTYVLNPDEYKKNQTKRLVDKFYKGSVKELAVSLFNSDELSKEDIDEIKKMFNL